MQSADTKIDATLLEIRLGAERWREVRRAAWRGTELEDGVSSAAAELVARQELRAARAGLLSFLTLALAGTVALLGVGDGWSIALAVIAVAGTAWSTAATVLLRRAVRVHEPRADHERLGRLLDGHSSAAN